MLTRLMFSTALALCALSLATPAMAVDPATLCDQLAASPFDNSRASAVPGVPFNDIVVAEAEPACRAAHDADPLPRFAFQLARVLDRDGRTEEALALYGEAAVAGHVEAKVGFGQATMDVARQHARALFAEASAAGSLNALYNLAVFARDDDEDVAAALALFEQAAARGDAEAAYNIGVMYDEGELVVRDVAQAARYYELAVAGDFSWARINLGYLLLEGTVEPAERARALELFRTAAEQDGDINAGLQLGLMIQDGSDAEQEESQALVLAALRARDFELARFLQSPQTGLSPRNLAAIFAELNVETLPEAVAALPAYHAIQP